MARPLDPDKRERLLGAAAVVFARDGYRHASVADVAEAAGVAKGGVYLYFESKEALFAEAFLTAFEGDADAMRVALAEGRDPEVVLDELFHHWAALEEDFEGAITMFLDFLAECGRGRLPPEVRGRAKAVYLEVRDLIAALIRDGVRRGQFREDVDATATGQAIIGFWDGVLAARLFVGEDVEIETSSREFLRILLRGIRK